MFTAIDRDVVEAIRAADLDNLKPLDALNLLAQLKEAGHMKTARREASGKRPMRVLGLMSGTSADGIDVALAEISGAPPRLKARIVDFAAIPYSRRVRSAILRLAEGGVTTTAEISQSNFLLGELFAEAALARAAAFVCASHGLT